MSAQHDANIAAVIKSEHGRFVVEERPIPKPGPGEVLVRNRAVAANPADWKIQAYGGFFKAYPNVLGSDVAGDVVAVGPDVHRLHEGDRILGFAGVIYNQKIDHGAWQTYTIIAEAAASKIPEGMTYIQGAVLPMGMATACIALFHELQIPRHGPQPAGEALLIWGGASSVGACAIQVARAHGWRHIFVTASSRHHGWLQKLGATDVFDYNKADVVDRIASAATTHGLRVRRAIDSISEGSTLEMVPKAVLAAGGEGAEIALMQPWPKDHAQPANVKINSGTIAARHAMDLKDLGQWFFNDWLEAALNSGDIVSAPEPEIVEGGIAAAQTVLDRLKAGVSGKKLVVQVD